jgi:hypothetical protein
MSQKVQCDFCPGESPATTTHSGTGLVGNGWSRIQLNIDYSGMHHFDCCPDCSKRCDLNGLRRPASIVTSELETAVTNLVEDLIANTERE